MTTDVNLEILQYLAPTLKNGLKFEIKEVVLSTDNVLTTGTSANGQFIVMPKEGTQQWGEVHDFVNSGLE